LIAGLTYYLAVTNPNAVPVGYQYEVDFDVTTLTNFVR